MLTDIVASQPGTTKGLNRPWPRPTPVLQWEFDPSQPRLHGHWVGREENGPNDMRGRLAKGADLPRLARDARRQTRLTHRLSRAIDKHTEDGAMPTTMRTEERATYALERGRQAKKRGLDTTHYFRNKDGTLHPERAREQAEILDEIKAEYGPAQERPKVFLTAGMFAAGKTSSLQNPDVLKTVGLDKHHTIFISADDIKDRMIEHGMVPAIDHLQPMEAGATVSHVESRHLTDRAIHQAIAGRQNIVLDSTLRDNATIAAEVQQFRDAGYEVHGILVDVKPEDGIANSKLRYERGLADYSAGEGHGGRPIPPSVYKQFEDPHYYSTVSRTFMTHLHLFDHAVVVDNSRGRGDFHPKIVLDRWQ